MAKQERVKFPKTLYVTREDEGNELCYLADEVPIAKNQEKVGIYQLVEVKTMHITEQLE